MKRPLEMGSPSDIEGLHLPDDDTRMKKVKLEQEDVDKSVSLIWNFGEDLLFEVLKHADARTLAMAACVSRQWKKAALDERLWELICTRHWANIGCGNRQLRSVVLALGGFRRLHSQYLWPLSKPAQGNSASSSSWAAPISKLGGVRQPNRWGKDEVHLSLSLLSIKYYEKMNFSNRGR